MSLLGFLIEQWVTVMDRSIGDLKVVTVEGLNPEGMMGS